VTTVAEIEEKLVTWTAEVRPLTWEHDFRVHAPLYLRWLLDENKRLEDKLCDQAYDQDYDW